MLDEGALHRMQVIAVGQAFDRDQLGTIAHHCQRQAGVDSLAIEQHRAGTTLAVVAAFFCANQVQLLTQQVEQCGPGQDLELTVLTIEGQIQRETGE
ncbi:hypothetical protein D3C86_1817620 [compost metagenome]